MPTPNGPWGMYHRQRGWIAGDDMQAFSCEVVQASRFDTPTQCVIEVAAVQGDLDAADVRIVQVIAFDNILTLKEVVSGQVNQTV